MAVRETEGEAPTVKVGVFGRVGATEVRSKSEAVDGEFGRVEDAVEEVASRPEVAL